MTEDHAKRLGDVVAYVGGGAGTLGQWSDFAGAVTPILSALFILLSIVWLLWRMFDRVRLGPRRRDDE